MSGARLRVGLLAGLVGLGVVGIVYQLGLRKLAMDAMGAGPARAVGLMSPRFDGADATRERIAVDLVPVAEGFTQITGLAFPPGEPGRMVVLQKGGTAEWLGLDGSARGPWLRVDVATRSEQGLLGLAFAPDFERSGVFYLHYSPAPGKRSRVERWSVDPKRPLGEAEPSASWTVLELEQPYVNHNAGDLLFGPDGMLYVGFGDGGARDDPGKHGQNPGSLLGAMLRLDVREGSAERPYRVPPDNPHAGLEGWKGEVWAIGLRNPWRISFDPEGRMVAGDVGQDAWEEITFVQGGSNLGWPAREGARCYLPPDCDPRAMLDPVYEYPHAEGRSVTGGYVATGDAHPALRGLYVFGDYASGRLWALSLPRVGERVESVHSLGRWPIQPATFGRDRAGDLYVADFTGGTVYNLMPGATD